MKRGASIAIAVIYSVAQPRIAAAQRVIIDLPETTLRLSVDRLAQQSGLSIAIHDRALAGKRVPRLRGKQTVEAALRWLARKAGGQLEHLGGSNWRLVPSDGDPRPLRNVAPSSPEPVVEPASDIIVQASKLGTSYRAYAGSLELIEPPPLGIDAGTQALVNRSTIISSTYRGAGRERLFIGGIADSSFSGRLQTITGLYLGPVRLTYSASDPNLQLYDIKSVEVLQGPQGTLYGSGSMAGIVRLNPQLPERGHYSGTSGLGVETTQNGGQGGDWHAVVNLPLMGNIALRAVAYARSEGGYIDKPMIGDNINRTSVQGGRAIMRWWAGSSWTVDVTGILQSHRNDDSQYAARGASVLIDTSDIKEPSNGRYVAGNVVVTGRIGALDFLSSSGIVLQRFNERFGFTNGQVPGDVVGDAFRRHFLFTHETRVGLLDDDRLSWVAGVNYTLGKARWRSIEHYGDAPFTFNIADDVSDLALFGEAKVRLAPFLAANAGLRASRVSTIAYPEFANPYSNPNGTEFLAQRNQERWLLPSAAMMATLRRDIALYVRYQQGRRPDAPVIAPVGYAAATSERIETLDVGARFFPGGRWYISASVQHSHWRSLRLDILESFLGYVGGDLGDWEVRSINGSASGPLMADLTIDAALTLSNSKPLTINAFSNASRLPDVARTSARLGAKWRHRVGSGVMARVDAWMRYEGASDATFGLLRLGRQGDYVLSGLNIDFDWGKGVVSVTGDNLLNAQAIRYLAGSLARAGAIETPLRPRTLRIGYRRQF